MRISLLLLAIAGLGPVIGGPISLGNDTNAHTLSNDDKISKGLDERGAPVARPPKVPVEKFYVERINQHRYCTLSVLRDPKERIDYLAIYDPWCQRSYEESEVEPNQWFDVNFGYQDSSGGAVISVWTKDEALKYKFKGQESAGKPTKEDCYTNPPTKKYRCLKKSFDCKDWLGSGQVFSLDPMPEKGWPY